MFVPTTFTTPKFCLKVIIKIKFSVKRSRLNSCTGRVFLWCVGLYNFIILHTYIPSVAADPRHNPRWTNWNRKVPKLAQLLFCKDQDNNTDWNIQSHHYRLLLRPLCRVPIYIFTGLHKTARLKNVILFVIQLFIFLWRSGDRASW